MRIFQSGERVDPCELYIHENGFLGASPDGLVVSSSGDIDRLIEINCPYSARNDTIVSECGETNFFCALKNIKSRDKWQYAI